MKFKNVEDLALKLNSMGDVTITGSVALIVHGILDLNIHYDYEINVKNITSFEILNGIKIDNPEDSLLFWIQEEEKLNFNIIDAERVFECISSYYWKLKDLSKLKSKIISDFEYENKIYQHLLMEIEEKYGIFDE